MQSFYTIPVPQTCLHPTDTTTGHLPVSIAPKILYLQTRIIHNITTQKACCGFYQVIKTQMDVWERTWERGLTGECFHSFCELSKSFTSVSIQVYFDRNTETFSLVLLEHSATNNVNSSCQLCASELEKHDFKPISANIFFGFLSYISISIFWKTSQTKSYGLNF